MSDKSKVHGFFEKFLRKKNVQKLDPKKLDPKKIAEENFKKEVYGLAHRLIILQRELRDVSRHAIGRIAKEHGQSPETVDKSLEETLKKLKNEMKK